MANPTVANMLGRLRGLLNEPEAAYVSDDTNEGIVWISEGVVNYFDGVVSALKEAGRDIEIAHPFLRHFVASEDGETAIDTEFYDYPDDMDYPLYLWYGKPLHQAARSHIANFDIDRDGDLFGPSGTRAVWCPAGSQFRIYTLPGDEGVPKDIVPWQLWYVQSPQDLTTMGATLPMPQRWTSGVLYWAAAQWAAKERKAPDAWMQLFELTVARTVKR
jgi:hypothetical protein